MSSPLSPLFPDPERLPAVFRRQFLHSPENEGDVLIEGVLDEVWYRPRWLGPFFWLLERAGILIAERAENVRTTLRVEARYDRDGQPYHLWYRRFYGEERVKKFDVKVIYDRASERAVDVVGHRGRLALGWDVRFIEPDTLKLDVIAAGLRTDKRIVWLPSWLWPLMFGREEFTQKVVSVAENRISINLLIRHPLFGPVFCYRGTFTVGSEPSLY